MRRRFINVKLSPTMTYKVRNLGDIGDAMRPASGFRALKSNATITLDFATASTNKRLYAIDCSARRFTTKRDQ